MNKFAALGALVGVVSFGVFSRGADAQSEVRFGAHDVKSVFSITKSENRNEVHFSVALDDQCRPRGEAPVRPYWLMNEHHGELEALLDREQGAYGIAQQRVEGTRVRVNLRARPDLTILVEAVRRGEACEAHAVASISGQAVLLRRVHLQLSFPFGLASATASGRLLGTGMPFETRLH